MTDKPPKPTPGDIEAARFHDNPSTISTHRKCECPVCAVRRRAEWERDEIKKVALDALWELKQMGVPFGDTGLKKLEEINQ